LIFALLKQYWTSKQRANPTRN